MAVRRADVLFGWNPALELGVDYLKEMRNLRLVQLASAGADHLDPSVFPEDTVLCSNAVAFADPIAEHSLPMVLALSRRLLRGHQELRQGVLDQLTPSRTLRGSRVGIIGYGGIGRAVADVFRPFGCPILAINRSGKTGDPVDFCGTVEHLPKVLAESDIVVLGIALTPATQKLIGRRELSFLREESMVVNVARAAERGCALRIPCGAP